jgi:hypothetical protein
VKEATVSMRVPSDKCFVVLPGQPRGRNVALCETGRIGVRVTGIDLGEVDEARAVVRGLNAALGVSPAIQREMVLCALHGWAPVHNTSVGMPVARGLLH